MVLFLVTITVTFDARLGWGGGIRTPECQYQKLVPYHLATPYYY